MNEQDTAFSKKCVLGKSHFLIKYEDHPFDTHKVRNKSDTWGIPTVAQWVKNPTSLCEDVGSIPGLAQWVQDLVLPCATVWVMDVGRIAVV